MHADILCPGRLQHSSARNILLSVHSLGYRSTVCSRVKRRRWARPIRRGLVLQCSQITCGICVRPRPLGRRAITRSSEVAHHPHTWPESAEGVGAWEGDTSFDVDRVLKAHLVPGLEHPGLEVEIVYVFLIKGDDKVSALCGDRRRVIPLEVAETRQRVLPSSGDTYPVGQ